MNFPDRKAVERLRDQFPVGCRIVLDHMDDSFVSIPPGTQGTCRGVDDGGNVMAAWDCGSSLSIAFGADRAHRVASEEEIRVSLNWLGRKQETAGHCPRCGMPLGSFERHALSRRANITICDDCGVTEALEDAGMNPRLPLSEWWCVQNNWAV